MDKNQLEPLLIVGAKIKIGKQYSKEHGLESGQVITLIEGYFDYENGLCTSSVTSPSIWDEDSKDYESIYHLFGNDLENWMDCKIVK